jgi:hypothetical protein
MAQLVANECVQCKRPVGYVTKEALQIPTMCPLCAFDKETMREWGHRIAKKEKPLSDVLRDLRRDLARLELGCRICGGNHPPGSGKKHRVSPFGHGSQGETIL